jgi:hypothetical protein
MFFFFIGRRYPFLTLILGVAVLVTGLVLHSTVTDLVGCVGILMGGYRTVAMRRHSVSSGKSS